MMDQREEKEKSDNSKTISNRFLELKNGLVHEKPFNCKIFGFRPFYPLVLMDRNGGETKIEEKP